MSLEDVKVYLSSIWASTLGILLYAELADFLESVVKLKIYFPQKPASKY